MKLWKLGSLIVLIQLIRCEDIVEFVNVTSVEGEEKELRCQTTSEHQAIWQFTPVGETEPRDINSNNNVIRDYINTIKLKTDVSTKTFSIVITSVEKTHAGLYTCIENIGNGAYGRKHFLDLVVLDARPVCSTNASSDGLMIGLSCVFPDDRISLTCTAGYTGNHLPDLRWNNVESRNHRNASLQSVHSESVIKLDRRVTKLHHVCQLSSLPSYTCGIEVDPVCALISTGQSHPDKSPIITGLIVFVVVAVVVIVGFVLLRTWRRGRADSNLQTEPKQLNHDIELEDMPNAGDRTANSESALIAPADTRNVPEECRAMGGENSDETEQMLLNCDEDNASMIDHRTDDSGVPVNVSDSNSVNDLKKSQAGLGQANNLVPERSIPSMDRRLVGMCVLTGNLYAVFKDLKAVFGYNLDDINSYDKIDVRNLKVPADIASCSVNQCLYVTDCDSSKLCVWKIKIADQKNPQEWLSGIIRPYTLSVNSRGEVLMLCNSASTSVLKIFKDSNGKACLLREFDFFKIRIRVPCFAKQLESGHFVVCEGEPGQHVQRIYLVEDVFGKLVRGSPEKPPDRLYCPVYAASCGSEVFVADKNNERVVVFDAEFKFVKVVASYREDKFGKPIRLHYDPSSRRLFVGQECGIRIYSYPVMSGATSK